MKSKLFFTGIALIILAGVYVFGTSSLDMNVGVRSGGDTLEFLGYEISIEVADNPASRAQGLSGRESMPAGTGLLFIFDTPDQYGFWMKDMNFPIDILWFDAERKLVDVTHNLSPDTFPQTFYPQSPAMYVLETNVGEFEVGEGDFGEVFELR